MGSVVGQCLPALTAYQEFLKFLRTL